MPAVLLPYAVYRLAGGEPVRRDGSIRPTMYASCVASVACMARFALTRSLAPLLGQASPGYALSLVNGTLCHVLPCSRS